MLHASVSAEAGCAVEKDIFVPASVLSQVVLSRTLSKKQMLISVATKIGAQLNCKLGGELWAVQIPVSRVSAYLLLWL